MFRSTPEAREPRRLGHAVRGEDVADEGLPDDRVDNESITARRRSVDRARPIEVGFDRAAGPLTL
jgi:hypothetical protein